MAIKRDISIEELTDNFPFSVSFLREKGIVCIVCGEPIWGTLEEVAQAKGYDDEGIDQLVNELNQKVTENDDKKPQDQQHSFSKGIGKLDKDNT